ncbi:MAG TPA: DUF6797 domain-containing protein [Planctomycetota bacterium]|nr:DUF6797 domain-containing protein [Planctomycetota bacterium]
MPIIRVILAVLLLALGLTHAGEATKKRWEQMDYGPFLIGTFHITNDKPAQEDYKKPFDCVMKGIIVRVSKEKDAYVCYDEETLRVAGAWNGGFIDYKGVIFNGEHHAQPRNKTALKFQTKHGPGWAKDGSLADPRPEPNGPLPADWLKYKGLYLHGDMVVLSYTVGASSVLEMPGVVFVDDQPIFTRALNISASAKPIKILICEIDGGSGYVEPVKPVQGGPAAPAKTGSASDIAVLASGDNAQLVRAAVRGAPAGAQWEVTGSQIVLSLPAAAGASSFKILIGGQPTSFEKAAAEPEDLAALTKGGAQRWPETVKTQGTLGTGEGAYIVDTIAAPDTNPYNAWMRFGGFDFFADGTRAALCTWSGDVWIVSGIDATLQNLTWKRFASGLYQPLGLKIVDDVIYTTCRDQLARLHDLNKDGEADFIECFNGDCVLTKHFHEFALDLQTDAQGNFYYAKGATPGRGGPNFDLWSIHTGCFFRIPKDGSKLEVVARGLRAPNGISIGPNGEMTSGDNEGSWVPSCPINWIKQGGFVGIPDGVPGNVKPTRRDDPICWLPWHVDNSSGAQVWVTSDKWGPFKNQLLHLSYGQCSLFNVMMENVGDTIQGGVSRFPINFASGIMRARFHPGDGQLYLCGLRGWQTTAARDGVFQRVRYMNKPLHMPAELHVTKTGLEVTFLNALDPESVKDTGNWSGWWFNVKWAQDYGSARWSPTDPSKKYDKGVKDPPGEPFEIKSVSLSADGKKVSIEIPGIKPVTNMIIKCKIKAADGTTINTQICNTINRMPQ